ncbi:MAG: mdh, partial [Paenibacillus sp.]|nr:mdh [Paenibacillus sp.]
MNIQPSKLRQFSNACLNTAGVPEREAQTITETMIEADAKGIHSHGLLRLPIYIERIRHGLMLPIANVTLERDNKATAVLDGHGSAGQVVASKAMELAIAKAEQYGIGVVSAHNSNHFGIAAHYALKASRSNMIGIVMSNT